VVFNGAAAVEIEIAKIILRLCLFVKEQKQTYDILGHIVKINKQRA